MKVYYYNGGTKKELVDVVSIDFDTQRNTYMFLIKRESGSFKTVSANECEYANEK